MRRKTKKARKRIFIRYILPSVAALAALIALVSFARGRILFHNKIAGYDGEVTLPTVDFVQPAMLSGYAEADYDAYFTALSGAGYDSVILQFTRYKLGGVCYVYYPSDGMDGFYEDVDDSDSDILGALLDAAERNAFDVYVGLSVDDDDWWGVTCCYDGEWMDRLGQVDVMMINEISALYGDRAAFKGWYWAHELYSNPIGMEKIWAGLINSSIDAVNALHDGRPIVLSPFRHVQTGLVTNEYRMWKRFFSLVNFREGDIFAPQDSMGKLNQNRELPSIGSYVRIYDYLNQVKRAVDGKPGLILWVNVELFQKENGDEYNCGDFERIRTQIVNASRVADTLVTFSLSHYALPQGTNDSAENRAALYAEFIGQLSS